MELISGADDSHALRPGSKSPPLRSPPRPRGPIARTSPGSSTARGAVVAGRRWRARCVATPVATTVFTGVKLHVLGQCATWPRCTIKDGETKGAFLLFAPGRGAKPYTIQLDSAHVSRDFLKVARSFTSTVLLIVRSSTRLSSPKASGRHQYCSMPTSIESATLIRCAGSIPKCLSSFQSINCGWRFLRTSWQAMDGTSGATSFRHSSLVCISVRRLKRSRKLSLGYELEQLYRLLASQHGAAWSRARGDCPSPPLDR